MQSTKLKILAVGNRIVPKYWYLNYPVKMQRLYYIKGGSGHIQTEQGGQIPFEAGKIYVHPYNLFADYHSNPDDPIDHIFFDFLSTPPIISDAPIVYDVAADGAVCSLIKSTELFLNELVARGVLQQDMISLSPPVLQKDSDYGKVLYGLLSTILDTLSFEKPLTFSNDAVVLQALDTIRHRYAEPISAQSLAAEANFDVRYFIRRFKHVMGITPYAYLRSYRLMKAKEWIDGGKSITEAAALVGYESAAALSRALKQENLKA